MNQSSEHSTPHLAKDIDWRDKYYINFYTQRKNVVSPQVIEALSKDLVKWADEDTKALKLSQFYLGRGISTSTFYYLAAKHPILNAAAECARELIGNRREIGGLKNKLNTNIVMSQMAKYDPSWLKLEVKRADLRARSQQKVDPDIKYAIVVEDFGRDKEKTNNLPEDE